MLNKSICLILPVVTFSVLISPPALADAISPQINNGEREYSTEKADTSYFGTGVSGRMSEASHLRFEGEQLLADGKLEEAKRKLGKAVMLDPGEPGGHIFYARCITRILQSQPTIDEKLLARCIAEWSLIWHHDADQTEQYEAKGQARRLIRIARALEKEKKAKAKQKKEALLAEKQKIEE